MLLQCHTLHLQLLAVLYMLDKTNQTYLKNKQETTKIRFIIYFSTAQGIKWFVIDYKSAILKVSPMET